MNGLETAINTATSTVDTLFGFGLADVTSWMWTNLALPWLGVGLGTIYELRYFIGGFIALAVIIYFARRLKGMGSTM